MSYYPIVMRLNINHNTDVVLMVREDSENRESILLGRWVGVQEAHITSC